VSCGRDAEPTPAIVVSVARVMSIAISPRSVAMIFGGQVQMADTTAVTILLPGIDPPI